MADKFELFDEPRLTFLNGQEADDPRDGLALFGAFGLPDTGQTTTPSHVVIGTQEGISLWSRWGAAMNAPAACEDISRHRPWPPYPGFDVAFGAPWPKPAKCYEIDLPVLDGAARKADRFERAFAVASLYVEPVQGIKKLDNEPALAVCIVPDVVYENCRPKSYVTNPSSDPPDRLLLKAAKIQAKSGQMTFFADPSFVGETIEHPEQYGLSPDFRRQLKARMMPHGLPVQIVRESTLRITEQVMKGQKGTNPLSDRLWNLGTAIFYKCGRKPWKLSGARDGVCYIGLAYRKSENQRRTACCAAQMFLDSGDGLVFLGDFGPWYSEDSHEFHLTADAAERLLRETLDTYREQDGRPLKEIFLHARSGINAEEFRGFLRACPEGARLIGVRVRQDRRGPRLFRNGSRPVLRGTFWQRTDRFGFLFANGFKSRIGTYDGFEVPVPLEITLQHGEADLSSVARDILGLTKLNYNACQLGEGMPITVKFSNAIGEILLANPSLPKEAYRHNFKFYI